MKKILRSTVLLAASVASFLPTSGIQAATGRQKKQRTSTHARRVPQQSPRADDSTLGNTGTQPLSALPALPLATPAAAALAMTPVLFALPAAPAVVENRYPWKRGIVTTTFWIGESPTKNNPVPNHASSWDPLWAQHYGGTDTPEKTERVDYRPASFVPGQNPFYIALPYNDREANGLKAEAAKLIPWFETDYKGPTTTVCKGRWVAIRFKGRVTYAQWEDCGPFRTDHAAYVFGDERPKPNLNKGAGLDVSPAVRDFLGMNDTDVTDWKFVDFDEVPPGPWSQYGDNNTFVINQRLHDQRLAALGTKKPAARE